MRILLILLAAATLTCCEKSIFVPPEPPEAPVRSPSIDLTPVTNATARVSAEVRESKRDVEEVKEDVDLVKDRIVSTEDVVNQIYLETQGENKKRAEEALELLAASQAALEKVSLQLAKTTESLKRAEESNEQAQKALDEQTKLVVDQEVEIRQLRSDNDAMRKDLVAAAENIKVLQTVQVKLDGVTASRNKYRFMVWGTCAALLISVAGYVALRVYRPF
jgi:chromosome segregation ATPase